MSGSTLVRVSLLATCLACLGLSGCKPKNDTPPPSGGAVTTEPLEIELPANGAPAAPAGATAPEGAQPAEGAKP